MKGRYCPFVLRLPILDKIFIGIALISAVLFNEFGDIFAHHYKQQRCSNRLQNALEHMRRRNIQLKSSRSLPEQTPYTLYHEIYGHNGDHDNDNFYTNGGDRGYYAKNIFQGTKTQVADDLKDAYEPLSSQRQPHYFVVSRVDVEDLRVKIPQKAPSRWVEVDKCKFSTENSTLDTRLIFPDLTISGKIVLQPSGGKCNMILRLRHAGIEFRTVPIGFDTAANEESRRMSSASVRTDSHFAEPGFISVFAHGCQGQSGNLRQISKRRFGFAGTQTTSLEHEFFKPQVIFGTYNSNRGGKLQNLEEPIYDIRSESYVQKYLRKNSEGLNWNNKHFDSEKLNEGNENIFYRKQTRYRRALNGIPYRRNMKDEINFQDDILNIDDNLQKFIQPDARAFANIFTGSDDEGTLYSTSGHRGEVGDALVNELEKLFSMGVRGLLTTYMQRALQPAIKETLMENMGYTLSYG